MLAIIQLFAAVIDGLFRLPEVFIPTPGEFHIRKSHQRASNLHPGLWLRSSPARGAGPAVPLPLQPRHTGAPHGDGHVDLRVGVAAADAGAGPLQDDGRGVDRSAAEQVALLPLRSDQAALTQAVGLGDVARKPGRLIIQPETVRYLNTRLELNSLFCYLGYRRYGRPHL